MPVCLFVYQSDQGGTCQCVEYQELPLPEMNEDTYIKYVMIGSCKMTRSAEGDKLEFPQ